MWQCFPWSKVQYLIFNSAGHTVLFFFWGGGGLLLARPHLATPKRSYPGCTKSTPPPARAVHQTLWKYSKFLQPKLLWRGLGFLYCVKCSGYTNTQSHQHFWLQGWFTLPFLSFPRGKRIFWNDACVTLGTRCDFGASWSIWRTSWPSCLNRLPCSSAVLLGWQKSPPG